MSKPSPPARHNDYQPPNEAFDVKSKQRIRQARRIRSLYSQIADAEGNPKPSASDRHGTLQQEWNAILRSTGYGVPFVEWILAWPEIAYLPRDVPTPDVLHDILQIVQ